MGKAKELGDFPIRTLILVSGNNQKGEGLRTTVRQTFKPFLKKEPRKELVQHAMLVDHERHSPEISHPSPTAVVTSKLQNAAELTSEEPLHEHALFLAQDVVTLVGGVERHRAMRDIDLTEKNPDRFWHNVHEVREKAKTELFRLCGEAHFTAKWHVAWGIMGAAGIIHTVEYLIQVDFPPILSDRIDAVYECSPELVEIERRGGIPSPEQLRSGIPAFRIGPGYDFLGDLLSGRGERVEVYTDGETPFDASIEDIFAMVVHAQLPPQVLLEMLMGINDMKSASAGV